MPAKQSYSFCFTLNNYTDDDLSAIIVEDDDNYICFGFEVGKRNTPHLQGYIRFPKKKTLNSAIDYFSRLFQHRKTHIEITKGSPKQAIDYCKKDGDFYEKGTQPSQGSATWDAIEDAMEDPRSNPHMYNQYKNVYNAIKVKDAKERSQKSLRLIHIDDRITEAQKHESVFLDADTSHYDLEEVMFLDAYTGFDIAAWYAGFPPKTKRGYELIPINPTIIYLIIHDDICLGHVNKKYFPIIDSKFHDLQGNEE